MISKITLHKNKSLKLLKKIEEYIETLIIKHLPDGITSKDFLKFNFSSLKEFHI